MSFSILQPPRILFGRGTALQALPLALGFGGRGIVVHGAHADRAAWLLDGARAEGAAVLALTCGREPALDDLQQALDAARSHRADWVLALGGGSVLDLGKALAALIPAPNGVMDHLEVVGKGLPLMVPPLPFLAVPTTAGTGAEVTKNAVIGLPDHGRKVSLRDDRMIARVAIVDPALTDHCPPGVTLASGLDAVVQVIEPYLSSKATPYTDALTRPAIAPGLAAVMRLMQGEDAAARDALAWTSLCGGLALANAGLGAVHGFAGVIGGMTGAAHGAICGLLLGPVLAANRDHTTGLAQDRVQEVCAILAAALGVAPREAPLALLAWVRAAGLPTLAQMGLRRADHDAVAQAAVGASSMKGNPVVLPHKVLIGILQAASG
ncbi:MAG: iron-containing alcohol dehydrogenase [Rhodobacteraceae bacterium]|nr:iron-containing alcohol dehydrogenase [Paracoccaceae bacterium]MCF8513191.1 iron-containing alcohol dehydrogenase [Paracoccaceae bacterium]MCF8517435.1 iron-containing alcohol dehydrogenase [Paracoccaceae bacterium]